MYCSRASFNTNAGAKLGHMGDSDMFSFFMNENIKGISLVYFHLDSYALTHIHGVVVFPPDSLK